MNLLDLIRSRQSDRAFDISRPIELEKLERILEAGRLAPSACNAQPWKFIVVNDPELKNKVADSTSNRVLGMNHFTKQAPVHILIVEERANFTSTIGSLVKKKEFPQIDVGIAAAHICLAAKAEGIGSCIIGWFDEKKLRPLLGIPSSKRILLDIILGYSTQPLREKQRKSADEVISYNKY
ncbi:nitroreductase family protein [Parabacteroides sp. FAFU027]|uniref:nitroreductase family protein n=1 Tax=Parabacteroides sp. FAFU027 TaxID=2922715 RepID=UPI001FAFCB12|nr:nitroreductase family protein [Parabacteroides sp. FAFU027]